MRVSDLSSHEICRNKQYYRFLLLFDVTVRYSLRKCAGYNVTLITVREGLMKANSPL